jgi:hypothetical protein
VGSDRVWDYKILFGLDPIYFGEFINSGKLISYACSFGGINSSEDLPRIVIQGLEKFSKLSVRDGNSFNIIKRNIGKEPNIALDPIFLYDYKKEQRTCPYKRYILVYAYSFSAEQIDQIRNFASAKKLKIIAVGYNQSWCDKNIIAIGPFEWLDYFRNASYVITSTFHGAMFSIKYRKNFILLNNVHINNKVLTPLDMMGLTARILPEKGRIKEILDCDIDYNTISKDISRLVLESKKYLENAIKY